MTSVKELKLAELIEHRETFVVSDRLATTPCPNCESDPLATAVFFYRQYLLARRDFNRMFPDEYLDELQFKS